jgi:hypothetical protein
MQELESPRFPQTLDIRRFFPGRNSVPVKYIGSQTPSMHTR